MDHHSRLGAEQFEQLQIMKSAWKGDIQDLAAWNSNEVETVVDLREYEDILTQDNEIALGKERMTRLFLIRSMMFLLLYASTFFI